MDPVSILVVLLIFLSLAALYVKLGLIMSCMRAEKLDASDAAVRMWQKRGGTTPDLPEKLRGVFWFGTNKAPELLVCFEGERWDPELRRLYITSGGVFNWTYSASKGGFVYWLFLRISYLFCATLHLNFDEDLKKANMPLYLFGCCWCPMGMTWKMAQIDENTWDRPIYLYCNPDEKWETGSYVFQRIIDANGSKMPAFDDMVKSVTDGLQGFPHKPAMQIMNGDQCFSCFGNPSGEKGYERLNP